MGIQTGMKGMEGMIINLQSSFITFIPVTSRSKKVGHRWLGVSEDLAADDADRSRSEK